MSQSCDELLCGRVLSSGVSLILIDKETLVIFITKRFNEVNCSITNGSPFKVVQVLPP
jgi:hypothetical protein